MILVIIISNFYHQNIYSNIITLYIIKLIMKLSFKDTDNNKIDWIRFVIIHILWYKMARLLDWYSVGDINIINHAKDFGSTKVTNSFSTNQKLL